MYRLVVTEKPSVGQSIAAALGVTGRKDGYMEGSGWLISWCIGHLPELRELVALLRRSSNNLNQLTRRVHETERYYDADIEDLQQNYEKLWGAAQKLLSSLATIQ